MKLRTSTPNRFKQASIFTFVIIRFKHIAIAEALIIIVLLFLHFYPWEVQSGLLSPRVYRGLLEPQSYLILNYAPLREELSPHLEKLNVSVYVVNFRDGASMGIRQTQEYIPASISKLPLAIILLKKIEDAHIDLDQVITINDSARTGRSGTLYNVPFTKRTLRFLIIQMLQESDNTAAHALKDFSESLNVSDDYSALLWDYLGYFGSDDVPFHRASVTTPTAYTTSPKSIYNLFSSLYLSTILTPEHSEYVLSLLTNTSFDIHAAAHIPEDVVIAQKYGSYYEGSLKYFHSCGILYPEDMRVFYCIMTKDLERDDAVRTIGYIVHNIYNYSISTRSKLDEYRNQVN